MQLQILQSLTPSINVWGVVLLVANFSSGEAAVARALVKVGEKFSFNSVPGSLVVKRVTPASTRPQYLFAVKCQDGSWTTDGSDKVGKGAHLSWNGDLVIDKFSEEDAGSYTFPMQEPQPGKANTLLIVEVDK
uniref:Uncharacterized protein n=1 Tax=Ditylenchus dipsaci TaxID=166011 RepID=A0A915EF62_9BILA